MKRQPSLSGPNNNNLREFEPYREYEDHTVIDTTWWNSLADISKDILIERCGVIELKDIQTPHEVYPKRNAYAYLAYVDSFDVQHWCEHVDGIHMYPIPEEIKKHLVTATVMGTDPHPSILEWIPEPPIKCFVRLSSTSGKNERAVRPVFTKHDILTYLIGNMTLVRRELSVDKDSYLILRPWVDFDRRYEFRAFFVQGKVLAVSQQHVKEFYHYTQEELDTLSTAMPSMSFNVPYDNWTADVYWDGKEFKLIECNPYGSHCGAGSSLFDWHDFPTEPTFKYLSYSRLV